MGNPNIIARKVLEKTRMIIIREEGITFYIPPLNSLHKYPLRWTRYSTSKLKFFYHNLIISWLTIFAILYLDYKSDTQPLSKLFILVS